MNNNFKPMPYDTKSKNANDSLSVSLTTTTREVGMSATCEKAESIGWFLGGCLVGGVVYWLYDQTKK